MRKFVVLHRKGVCTVQEVECEAAPPYRTWESRDIFGKIIPVEKTFIVSAPEEFKTEVWMGWFFHETEADAYARANLDLRGEFERKAMKSKMEFDEKGFLAAVAAIKINRL